MDKNTQDYARYVEAQRTITPPAAAHDEASNTEQAAPTLATPAGGSQEAPKPLSQRVDLVRVARDIFCMSEAELAAREGPAGLDPLLQPSPSAPPDDSEALYARIEHLMKQRDALTNMLKRVLRYCRPETLADGIILEQARALVRSIEGV